MQLAERPPSVRPNILLYGPEGSGKTAGACSAPGIKLLFNLDLPNRTRFARSAKRDPHRQIMEPLIAPFQPGGMHAFNLMREIMELAARPDCIPDVIITDPIDELYRRLLEEVSNRAVKPVFDHRIAVTTYIERYARFLCEQPNVSVIFVCQEMLADKGIDEGLESLPYVGSKAASMSGLGPKLRRMVDIVAYCGVAVQEDGSKEYGAQMISEKGRRGKDGFDCLGDYQPLDLARWWSLIEQDEETGEAGDNVDTGPLSELVTPQPPGEADASDPSTPASSVALGDPESDAAALAATRAAEAAETAARSASSSKASSSSRGRARKAAA